MTMLTAAELASMRAQQTAAMPELVTIKRRVLATDGFGGYEQASLTTVATDVPARITPAQVMTMGGQGDRALELEKWIIRVPYGTDLQDRDLIEWGTQEIKVEEVKSPRSFATNVSATGEVVK